jgi:hypothetical protein
MRLFVASMLAGLAAAEPVLDPADLTKAAAALEAYAAELAAAEQAFLLSLDAELPARLTALEERLAVCRAYLATGQLTEAGAVFVELRSAVAALPEPLREQPTSALRRVIDGLAEVAATLLNSVALVLPEAPSEEAPEPAP